MNINAIDNSKAKFLELSELGSKFNLAFSSQEVLGNKIIGLDGIKRKLLILEENNGKPDSFIIDLNKVSNISVKKSYKNINAGDLKKKGLQEFLKSIVLQFFEGRNRSIILPIYEHEMDHISDLPKLEKKAKNWQTLLSKMMGSKTKKQEKEKTFSGQ